MENKPKGFVKKRIGVTSGDAKITDGPTYLDYKKYRLPFLDVENCSYDRSQAIRFFGSIEKWEKYREHEVKIYKKQIEKEKEKRESNPEAYKMPTYSKYAEPSPSFTIGKNGIAKQRED